MIIFLILTKIYNFFNLKYHCLQKDLYFEKTKAFDCKGKISKIKMDSVNFTTEVLVIWKQLLYYWSISNIKTIWDALGN